jgi:hypothetical protein
VEGDGASGGEGHLVDRSRRGSRPEGTSTASTGASRLIHDRNLRWDTTAESAAEDGIDQLRSRRSGCQGADRSTGPPAAQAGGLGSGRSQRQQVHGTPRRAKMIGGHVAVATVVSGADQHRHPGAVAGTHPTAACATATPARSISTVIGHRRLSIQTGRLGRAQHGFHELIVGDPYTPADDRSTWLSRGSLR